MSSENNAYIAAVLSAVSNNNGGQTVARDATPAATNVGVPRRVLQFVGFLHALPGDLWRIHTTAELDEGVEFPKAAKLTQSTVKSPDDGRTRDVVTVPEDADVIYWTRKPPRPRANREPGGGGEYPII